MPSRWLFAFVLLFSALTVRGDMVSLPNTRLDHIAAKANGIDYKLYVGLPAAYASSDERYAVLYVLDADYSFPIAQTIIKHLSERDRLQPIIVVGIAYPDGDQYTSDAYRLNRTRDYTPRFAPDGGYGAKFQKVSGGAPKFLQFIRDELIPKIDREYRTIAGARGISGHSYGGLFATWVLLAAPDTFSCYVIVSPSLWYDDRFIFGLERQQAKSTVKARVYMAVGAREGDEQHAMVADLERMAKRLADHPALQVKHEVFDDEMHDSVFPTALSRGLRFVFRGD